MLKSSNEDQKKKKMFKLKMANYTRIVNSQNENGSCACQLLRSASSWSLGLNQKNPETSIQVFKILFMFLFNKTEIII